MTKQIIYWLKVYFILLSMLLYCLLSVVLFAGSISLLAALSVLIKWGVILFFPIPVLGLFPLIYLESFFKWLCEKFKCEF